MKLSLLIFFLSISFFAHSQNVLTLEKCFNIAVDKNISIKIAKNNELIAENQYKQSKYEFFPDLNFFANYNIVNGLTVDQTTGEPVTETTKRSFPSFSSTLPIYGGFQNHHRMNRTKANSEAARFNTLEIIDDTRIAVLRSYLQVLISRSNVRISEERLNLLNEQLERARKRFEIGIESQENVFNLQSQIATENLNRLRMENDLQRNKLSLFQLLQLDPSEDYEIKEVEIDDDINEPDVQDFSSLSEAVTSYSPLLKNADLTVDVAENDLKLAKADRHPTISATGGYGSSFSSVNNVSFFDQIDLNEQKSINISLNIPIFNRFRTTTNIDNSRLQLRNAELNYKQTVQNLNNEIQQAYLDLLVAQSTYDAAEENLKAIDQTFEFTTKRYQTGNTDFYTYIESLNNKNRAEIELANAKYSIVFRNKILEVYQGI